MTDFSQFNAILGEATHYGLLRHEMRNRCYVYDHAKWDPKWRGDALSIRFEAAQASSIRYGKLTRAEEVGNVRYAKGVVSQQKEIWGSMKWKSADLRINENVPMNLRYIEAQLPNQLKAFMNTIKTAFCMNVLNSNTITRMRAVGTATGVAQVRNIERLMLFQKVVIKHPTVAATLATGWIDQMDMNGGAIKVIANYGDLNTAPNTPGIDLSGFPAGSTLHFDGAEDKSTAFTSLIEQLDAANDDLFTLKKSRYPFLQAVNFDAARLNWTAENMLSRCFDVISIGRLRGASNVSTLMMSMRNLNIAIKNLEKVGGPYKYVDSKAKAFNYTEITIGGPDGAIVKLVGLYEMDDAYIIGPDWDVITVHSNNGFRREVSPEGNYFKPERTENGYEYLTDIALIGELVVSAPYRCLLVKNLNIVDADYDTALYGATTLRSADIPLSETQTPSGSNVIGSDSLGIIDAIKSFQNGT